VSMWNEFDDLILTALVCLYWLNMGVRVIDDGQCAREAQVVKSFIYIIYLYTYVNGHPIILQSFDNLI
jgi:hypothetical protein